MTELYDLSVQHNLGLHEVDLNTYALSGEEESGVVSELMTVQTAIPTVEFIEANSEGVWIPPERLPALLIDIRATDKTIDEQFKSALKEIRKRFPPPVAKSGPQKPNTVLDQDTFCHWIEWRIVQLAELLVWRAMLDKEENDQIRDYTLGLWMWGDESEPKKISEATHILKRAISCRHALLSQIAHETPQSLSHVVEQATINQILKNITYTRDAQGEPDISVPQKIEFVTVQKIQPPD